MTAADLSRWYSGLDLPCPFLAERSCSIYPFRPLACREHLAAGRAGGAGKAEVLLGQARQRRAAA